jgi:hypothetical protein
MEHLPADPVKRRSACGLGVGSIHLAVGYRDLVGDFSKVSVTVTGGVAVPEEVPRPHPPLRPSGTYP